MQLKQGQAIRLNHVYTPLTTPAGERDPLRGRNLSLQETLKGRIHEICLAAIEKEVSLAQRNTLGLSLGRVNDPRIVVDLRVEGHPEDHGGYVEIPAGQYVYGDNREPWQLDQAFWISHFPVTYGQFELFINDMGYDDEQWWSDDGREWLRGEKVKEPLLWRAKKWNGPNQPVVGVSFWEAEAFAKWAGASLPSERQWEAAARGPEGCQFPWGDEWTDGTCNSFEAGLEGTSPVGLFPSSRPKAYELHDMAGNVWEWCKDELHGGRVLRGAAARGTLSRIEKQATLHWNAARETPSCLPGW